MTVKAMILAAGRGERMKPLTDNCPKPLLKAAGKPLIVYHIEALKRAGVTDVVVNNAWLGQQIVDYLGDGSAFDVHIAHSSEEHGLETAGGILNALPLLGDEPFIVINGDIWTDIDLAGLVSQAETFPDNTEAHLVLVNNPDHNQGGDFAIDDGFIANEGNHRLTFSGMAIYHPDFFASLEPGKKPLAPLIREKADQHLITGEHYSGYWSDIGTPERLAALEHYLSSIEDNE